MKNLYNLRFWRILAEKLRSGAQVHLKYSALRCSFLDQTALKRAGRGALSAARNLCLLFVMIGGLTVTILPQATVMADDPIGRGCQGVDATLCRDNTEQPIGGNSIYGKNGILTKAARIVAIITAIGSIIVIIIGGIRYAMSFGDPNNINGAKNAIMFALIGLVIAGLSQAIVLFVLEKL